MAALAGTEAARCDRRLRPTPASADRHRYPGRPMSPNDLRNRHLADLHLLAAEHGVERYRMLPKPELAARLEEMGVTPPPVEEGRQEGGETEGGGEGSITGTLIVTPKGHGFIRPGDFEPAPGDIYVSASQIRRCNLQAGDKVSGPTRGPRRGERHPAIVRIELVNDEPPADELPPDGSPEDSPGDDSPKD